MSERPNTLLAVLLAFAATVALLLLVGLAAVAGNGFDVLAATVLAGFSACLLFLAGVGELPLSAIVIVTLATASAIALIRNVIAAAREMRLLRTLPLTRIVDPEVEVRETKNQIDDLMNEVRGIVERKQRVLVTTLTKKMSEDLTEYLLEHGFRVRYLHSEVDTIERIQIIRDLRLGEYDVLVGVNLLREGLDIPEVGLVAILDADKEGFLRGSTSLIQTIGRAARNVEGRVLMYADRESEAMRTAIGETDRRREIQLAYNREHGITPETVQKGISEISEFLSMESKSAPRTRRRVRADSEVATPEDLEKLIVELEEEMLAAAEDLRFEEAARIRDELKELRRDLEGLRA